MTSPSPAPDDLPVKRLGVEDAAAARPLESRRRLSESRLWDTQRVFYERHGAAAWGTDLVPHYITCNPSIADSYARAIVAFLRDSAASGRLDLQQPVHVIELGSGSGRFAFLLHQRLTELLAATELAPLPVTVVVTDFEESKLARLREHPQLEAPIAAGTFDFARFDATSSEPLHLQVAGTTLTDGSARNPLVVVANYVFDSLLSDAYAVHGGRLHEALVTVTGARPEVTLGEPEHLDHLELSWDVEPAELDDITDPGLRAVAAAYEAQLDDTMFLLPTAAVACLRRVHALAGSHPMLALVGDKGHAHRWELLSSGAPQLVTHNGCFSVMVNFDALAHVTRSEGGAAFLPAHRPPNLVVGAYVLGGDLRLRELARAYQDHLEAAGPDDVFAVRSALRPSLVDLDLDQVLAHLRTSRWDSAVLLEWFSHLLDLAASASPVQRGDVRAAVDATWRTYFSIGERADLPLCLGLLLSAVHHYAEAIVYFERSFELHGSSANTHFAAAIAHYGLRDLGAAEKHARAALAADPAFSGARGLLVTLEAEERPAP